MAGQKERNSSSTVSSPSKIFRPRNLQSTEFISTNVPAALFRSLTIEIFVLCFIFMTQVNKKACKNWSLLSRLSIRWGNVFNNVQGQDSSVNCKIDFPPPPAKKKAKKKQKQKIKKKKTTNQPSNKKQTKKSKIKLSLPLIQTSSFPCLYIRCY